MPEISLILHDIRSSENVGSMFRTADAAGVQKVYVTGYTPAPLDRFQRKNAKLAKAALGAETSVSWERHADIFALICTLKEKGAKVIAVEQSPRSILYSNFKADGPAAFIMGNEVAGIDPAILETADVVVEIPMHGSKESLNVSVAAGVILFSCVSQ